MELLVLSVKHSWKAHLQTVKHTVLQTLRAVLVKGGFWTDPTLKLYQSKAIFQLPYEAEIWGWNDVLINNLETVQNLY